MKRRARLAALLTFLTGTALSAGQNPPAAANPSQPPSPPPPQGPTFRVRVDYVEVDVVVTDQQGNLVRDLMKEDFRVLEDGKPQAINTFTLVDIPIERPDRPLYQADPIEPDVKSNEQPFDGRVYVMVIDDYHTNFGRTQRVKLAAKQFIEQRLAANDLMAIVHTAGPSDASQEFTSSKKLLLAAVDRTMGRKLKSATANRTEEYYRTRDQRQTGDVVNDPEDAERAFNARSTLDTLRQVSDWFASVRGRRKTILFVRIEIGSFPDDTSTGIGTGSLYNELRLAQDSLRVLSDETGGFAVVNRNDFSTAYQRIVQDNSAYYVLAYYPPDARPGRLHKIDVRVTRPGLVVRSRKAYLTPKKAEPVKTSAKDTRSPEVREALDSPLPISGLGMSVFAAPFKGTPPNASVLLGVELRGRDLRMGQNDQVQISYFAIDAQGKVRGGNTDSLTMNVKPETKTRIAENGVRMLNRIDLPPGRYQLRVAAHDGGGGSIGSVLYDVTVPDFVKMPISMSGIALTSVSSSGRPTVRPDEQLRMVLPASPVGNRTFPQNDEIALFAEIYDNSATSPHKVDITSTITTDEGKVMFKADDQRDSSELGGRSGGYGYSAKIPLKDIAPGRYVLTVSARSRVSPNPTAERQVRITVRN